jgi:hypothetical protein
MNQIPGIILKNIFEKLPRRTVEESVIFVSTQWRSIGLLVLSEEIVISDFCNLPPGYEDELGKPNLKTNIIKTRVVFQHFFVCNLTPNF